MDKIKKALEQARKDREQVQSGQKTTGSQAVTSDVDSIKYTKTQTVDGSSRVMNESRLVDVMDQNEYSDALKILSTQVLQRMEENQWTSIGVTAPRKLAGASTVAVNLGLGIAREFEYTVLVVDANLRAPRLHEMFGIEPKAGLSDYLAGDTELSDVLINPHGISHFVMLPGGKAVKNSSELMGSPRMSALVGELTSRYPKRIIIFDMPAVLETADTLSLIPNLDSALIVIEDDETKEKDLSASIDMLSTTNVIGTVLNKSVYY